MVLLQKYLTVFSPNLHYRAFPEFHHTFPVFFARFANNSRCEIRVRYKKQRKSVRWKWRNHIATAEGRILIFPLDYAFLCMHIKSLRRADGRLIGMSYVEQRNERKLRQGENSVLHRRQCGVDINGLRWRQLYTIRSREHVRAKSICLALPLMWDCGLNSWGGQEHKSLKTSSFSSFVYTFVSYLTALL